MTNNEGGLLGHKEISQMLQAIGVKVSAAQLQEIISEVVGDESKVDFDAFTRLMTRKYKQLNFDDEVEMLFNTLDSTHDGILDSSDIISLLGKHGHSITPGDAESLLAVISDTPGGMNKSEFLSFVKSMGAIVMPNPPSTLPEDQTSPIDQISSSTKELSPQTTP